MKCRRLVAVILVGVGALAGCSSDGDADASPAATATSTTIEGVQTYTVTNHDHTTDDVTYPESPPVGGDHDSTWQNCGVYDTPVRDETAVHSMEHGAVWLAYRPDLPADQVEVIRALARGHSHVLVSPYEGLTEAVVASAWGTQLRLDSVDEPRLAQFVATYEQGPQTPEPGAPCSGGTGDPIE